MHFDPQKRPTASQSLQYAFFQVNMAPPTDAFIDAYRPTGQTSPVLQPSGPPQQTGANGGASGQHLLAQPLGAAATGGQQQQQQSLHPGQAIFPQDRRSLGYEVMTTLYPHLLHCEHCPTNVKVELQQKYAEHQHYNSMSQQRKHSNYKRRNKKAIKLCHEERIFFKTLWFAMGHKETMMEHRGTGGNNTQYPSSSSRPSQREINKIRFVFRS